jgi:hypothetical protein
LSRPLSAHDGTAVAPRRGRPPKFGKPGHVVSLTLPDDTVQALNQLDPDTGWAIVKLLDREARRRRPIEHPADVGLAHISTRRSLIVVSRATVRSLPGVSLIPFNDTQAFLVMEFGRGLSDLELAVIDRLSDAGIDRRERTALEALRSQLSTWRHDRQLTFHSRSIILVEHAAEPSRRTRSRSRTGDASTGRNRRHAKGLSRPSRG